jgi:hypothetical protein
MPLTGPQRESRQHERSNRAKSHGKTTYNRTSGQQDIETNTIDASITMLTAITAPTANTIRAPMRMRDQIKPRKQLCCVKGRA